MCRVGCSLLPAMEFEAMKTFLALLLSALSCSVAQAEQADLNFLIPGKVYVIRFAEEHIPFKHESTPLEVFKIVKLHSSTWVEVEYPTKSADYGKWTEKLKAQVTLAEAKIAELEKTPEGKAKLKSLQDSADRLISTRQVLINYRTDPIIEIKRLQP